MKKNFVLFVTILLSLTTIVINAQSIWFLNPTNGQTVIGTGSQTTVYMQLNFGYSLSGSPYMYDHYIKLFRPPYSDQQSGQGGGITFDYDLPIGTYTWRLELWECYYGSGCLKKAEQTVTFYVKHKMWALNNFQGGDIKIDNQTVPSGTETHKLTGNSLLVGAIDQSFENYFYIWNQSGANNSRWERKPWNQIYSPINGGTPRDFNYPVASNDNGAAIRGMLKKRYTITRDDQTDAGTQTNQQTWNIVEQHSGEISAPATKIINNKTYNFIGWKDNLQAPNPRTITPTDNETYTAIYKAPQLSNDQNAYKFNNQRKFIRTPNGTLHSTYHSMNAVWYEISTNNGQTWQLIGYSIGSNPNWIHSEPSISYYINSANQTVVVQTWRLQRGDPYDWIRYRDYVYESTTPIISDEQEVNQEHPEMIVEEQTSPIVACANDGKTLFVWENKIEGSPRKFKFAFGKKINTYWEWYDTGTFEFTTSDVSSPSVYASIINNNLKFHFAWTERNSVYYCYLYPDVQNQIMNSSVENVSYNSGYSSNYKPSITTTDWVVSGTRYEHIRLAWIGYRDAYADNPPPCAVSAGETRMLFKTRSSIWSPLGVYGNNVNSVSTNKGTNVINNWEPFAIAWSEGVNCNYTNKYIRSHDGTKPPIRSLNTTGSEIQLNNATDFTTMYVNSFNRPSIPYYFTLSQNLSGALGKIESMAIFLGREGVITKDSTDFYYAVGDVTLDGQNIDFIEMPDSLVINNIQIMNDYLSSEPFTVSNASTLTYGIQYGIIDSLQAVIALSDGSEINFKIELVDNQTGEVLGVFDEVSYSSENVFQYNNIGYQVDLSGVGNRTVLLRLIVNTSAECDYAISNRYSDAEVLNKSGYKQITYKDNIIVKEYALEQNYPNPFNPATTIKYQIPKAGIVTLKIYDVLGNEIATLIDEHQSEGRYEANFDASKLASGVYIYRLNVNDFVNVKKMVLLR
ncbi:MAG TPA: T9SS type A sorting domain-containing protein [Ignavibacteriaceae bacterium]|nr:T9SS type A sorting domain-containing protein [Ignavibacteriaceae bacterium]